MTGALDAHTSEHALDDLLLLRRRLLNVVGHELRTPISTVRGLADIVVTTRDESRREEAARALQRNATRLERLVDDLLVAAGIATALPVGEPEVIDLAALIRRTWASLGSGVVEVRGVEHSALARRSAVDRIAHAVLDNAAKYGTRPPTVTIASTDDTVVVTVDSPGEALVADDVRMAREPFWRGERAVMTVPGLGLGLAVAAAIAQGEGGALTVAAREGGGLTTTITLPRS